MKRLIVCGRDPNCEWTRIVDADDPNALDAQTRHHAAHDRIAVRRAARLFAEHAAARRVATSAVRAERGGRGSAAPAPRTNCACCELGLFGIHGVGHVMAARG